MMNFEHIFNYKSLYLILYLIFISGVSYILTGLVRRYALKKNILDHPNQRSSHEIATPRGGGVAIVVVFLFGLTVLSFNDESLFMLLKVLVIAGGWVAFIGFVDDHSHIPAHWRLLAHFLGAGFAVFWFNGLPPIIFFGNEVNLGWFGDGLAVIYLVWLLNLYNFMDGIDGIAGIEALTVCLGSGVLYALTPASNLQWEPLLLLFAGICGFLVWNFPRAKIFSGDAGSGFIGFVLGVLSIEAAWHDPKLFWGWIILLGTFVVDATVTLLRRILRGDRFFEAHRSHAYQNASRKYNSHIRVSIAVGLINLIWLLPIAIMVVVGLIDSLLGLLLSYLPLILIAIQYKAGAKDQQ
jgi:Fuc2NAc and GlcNAc transferase